MSREFLFDPPHPQPRSPTGRGEPINNSATSKQAQYQNSATSKQRNIKTAQHQNKRNIKTAQQQNSSTTAQHQNMHIALVIYASRALILVKRHGPYCFPACRINQPMTHSSTIAMGPTIKKARTPRGDLAPNHLYRNAARGLVKKLPGRSPITNVNIKSETNADKTVASRG